VAKVIPELRSDKAKRSALLSRGKHGSWNTRSAIDAAPLMVDSARSAWTDDKMKGVLLIEIEGAFPSVPRGRLHHAMKAK